MATETNLTRVNLFPSEASYISNRGSLANTELSLIKIDSSFTSDVQSSSFGSQSGYVKFLNGLMICYSQGTRKGDNGKYTFPQAFAEIPCVVCNLQDWGNKSRGVRNITKTYFEAYSDSTTNSYMAIGLWKTSTTHTGVNVRFHQGYHYGYNSGARNISDIKFTISYTNENNQLKEETNPTSIWIKSGTTFTINKVDDIPDSQSNDAAYITNDNTGTENHFWRRYPWTSGAITSDSSFQIDMSITTPITDGSDAS